MQVQKSKLSHIAEEISKQLSTLHDIAQTKRSFAQKINYQVSTLFSLISNYPTISSRDLCKIFEPLYVKLLIQNKKYLTAQDLCNYLGVSDKHAMQSEPNRTKFKDKQIQIDSRYQLEDIMQKQVSAMQKIRQSLKFCSLDVVFNEIDFFNNGYIDATSLADFVKHHGGKESLEIIQQQNQLTKSGKSQGKFGYFTSNQARCMEVIRYLKGSATAEKIFYNDFLTILEDPEVSQNPEQTFNFPNHSLSLSRSIGHIARVSQLQILHSRSKRPKLADERHPNILIQQSNLHNFTASNASNIQKIQSDQYQYEEISTIKGKISPEDLDRINKTLTLNSDIMLYEEKICANHWRNSKYLEKLKLESSLTNFKPHVISQEFLRLHDKTKKSNNQVNIQERMAKQKYRTSFYPIRQTQQLINRSEILYQFKYLAQVFDKYRKQLQSFLNENQNFSIINGFNVIDVQDRGYVSYKQLKQFLFEIEVLINENKIRTFFDSLASPKKSNQSSESGFNQAKNQEDFVIFYAKFAIKVFHLKIIENSYRTCRRRKPLITQQWPEQQRRNYCRFIRSVISTFYEISTVKKALLKMLQLPEEKDAFLSKNVKKGQNSVDSLKDKMELIFQETDIHFEKMNQILGKNSETFILEMYENQTVLEPKKFCEFLYKTI